MLRRRGGTVWERLSHPSPDPPRYSGAGTGSNSLVRETAALWRPKAEEKGVALDTTAVALEVLMLSRAGEIPPSAVGYVDHMPIGYQRYRRRSFVDIDSPAVDQTYKAAFQKLLDTGSI